jgi:hypothetical protein
MIKPNLPKQHLRTFGVLVIGVLAVAVPVLASASTQSFSVLDNKTQTGMLVSLTANSDVVAPATDKNAAALLGVTTDNTTDISYSQKPGQVSVQTDGEASVLVSTLGGDVLIGDRIAPSSLAGIGQKIAGSGWIAGVAQASLDAKTAGAVATTVTDTKGARHQVYVARIPIVVHVTYYTVSGATESKTATGLPDSIQKIADAVAGKHASLIVILLSFLLLFIGVVSAGIIINSTVRGTFLAISRQPLSKAAVLRMMMRSLGVALGIIIAVFLGALLILKLL